MIVEFNTLLIFLQIDKISPELSKFSIKLLPSDRKLFVDRVLTGDPVKKNKRGTGEKPGYKLGGWETVNRTNYTNKR